MGGSIDRSHGWAAWAPEVRIVRIAERLFVLLAALALAGEAAPAQGRSGRQGADSLQAGNLLDRIDFHPAYSSGYAVNRTSRDWRQTLDISRRIAFLDFNNKWTLGNRRDKAQSNLRSRRGQMNLTLDYRLEGYGTWTAGLDGNFRRDSQLSTLRDQVQNTSDLGLATTSGLPDLIVHSLLPPLRNFTLSSGANLGYSLERSVNRRATRLDSTRVGGYFQKYDLGLDGSVRSLRISTKMDRELRSGDSKTRQRNVKTGELDNEESDKTDNRKQNWDYTLDWSPSPKLKGTVTGHSLHEINQYWDIQANNGQGGQESKDGRDRAGQIRLEWKPNYDMDLSGQVSTGDISAGFQLQPRDFRKRTRSGRFEGRVKLPSAAGPLAALELQSAYATDEATNILEETADYRQENRSLRTMARRQLLRKVQLQGTNEISILQYFYDDHKNDRDERRVLNDGVLTYTPSSAFNGQFNVNWTKRQLVSILNAKNNSTTQTYKVAAEVEYTHLGMSIDQRYTVQADYTFYDFNEKNNILVRSNEVATTFSDFVGGPLGIGLSHQYQYRDSGRYIRIEEGGPRTYNPSSKEIRHALTLTADYPVGRFLRLHASQMLDRRRTRLVSTGAITTTERGELSLKADLQHSFSDDFTIRASFQKTESTSERDYWTVDASIQRNF